MLFYATKSHLPQRLAAYSFSRRVRKREAELLEQRIGHVRNVFSLGSGSVFGRSRDNKYSLITSELPFSSPEEKIEGTFDISGGDINGESETWLTR